MAVKPGGDPREHYCDAPGCTAWGSYGFKWGATRKWACAAHRERGADWLARAKSAGQRPPEPPPPAETVQGRLL